MKKGLWGAFRSIPVADSSDWDSEKVETLACSGDAIYIGTAQGNLVQFDIDWSAAVEDFAASAKRRSIVRLASKKPVEQVHASDNLVFALADGVLSILPADLSKTTSGQPLCREVKRFCLHTGVSQEGQTRQHEVCVCFKKKLVLYVHNGKAFEQRQAGEFPVNEAALALAWHQSWICVGERRQYILYSDRAGVPREICQIDGKFAPQIIVSTNNEMMLLIQESVGLFFNLSLQTPQPSSKNMVTWPRKVVSLGAAGNYVFGSTGNGQVDVFGLRDQKNCQTLSLEGITTAMIGVGGRLLVSTEAALTCLDPIPFERQVQKLLQQVRVADALSLLNANFGPEDPKRDEQLSRFHALAGWALFKDLQFLQAFNHFLYAPDLSIARVLVFWRKHLPASWDAVAAGRPPPGKPPPDDRAPESCDIDDFVRAQLDERNLEGGASSSSASVSANVDMANAAMVKFLLKQREALRVQDRLPPDQRMPSLVGTSSDLSQLVQAVDTLLLKLLIEADTEDLRVQEVLQAGVNCTVEDCERFLRDRQRLDVLARLWKARGMYDLVLQEWSCFLSGGGDGTASLDARTSGTNARVTRAQAAAEMADALRSAVGAPGGVALLRRYVPDLLAVEPSAVLPIFTQAGQRILSTDEVLQLLQNHSELVLGYLEYVVENRKDAEPHHRSKLGLLYVQQVEDSRAEPGRGGVEQSSVRQKLLRFLESTVDLDVHALLPKVEALGLHEERVVLYSAAQRHLEALRTLVIDLDDLQRAEIYCRIIMARTHRLPAATASESAAGGLRVLCTDPPDWARGIAFGDPKKAKASSDDEQDLAAAAREVLLEVPDASCPKPLMLLLRVLIDASAGAAEKTSPSRYQDAAIALLNAYAGHCDLPAHEVIDMLPSTWTLSCLSSYLSRSARLCLHERRSSVLEENLSSMAYLKTFSIWARERKRKVHITGDKCCPVCNRRFVDKDSVGKAFVAYPNETCVHLQCKEDISICPKTGRNFADNFSVCCHALGMELAE